MEHVTSGNLHDPELNPKVDSPEASWKQISIKSQSLDDFTWDIVCDERWTDPHKEAYECHRITRKAQGLGGFLYSVATHITPVSKTAAPSVSESLIFVPMDENNTGAG
tara:strand:+ start:335 stop:658 length:324 start_codon:yes stop_codon:yes gene_type:complete